MLGKKLAFIRFFNTQRVGKNRTNSKMPESAACPDSKLGIFISAGAMHLVVRIGSLASQLRKEIGENCEKAISIASCKNPTQRNKKGLRVYQLQRVHGQTLSRKITPGNTELKNQSRLMGDVDYFIDGISIGNGPNVLMSREMSRRDSERKTYSSSNFVKRWCFSASN